MRRMIRQATTIVLAAVVFSVVAQAAETKYGAGVTIATATPIKELYASPEKFIGKTVRVDGIVTAICTEMGCWLALGAADNPDQVVRFQADHDGKIVFPIALKGKPASAEGVFVKIEANDKEAHEAAAEHAHGEPNSSDFNSRYQIKVTGAVVSTNK
ncbi:MAG: DUF4920 domain-containing protein [Vicinamibacterales bacterium]